MNSKNSFDVQKERIMKWRTMLFIYGKVAKAVKKENQKFGDLNQKLKNRIRYSLTIFSQMQQV